VVFLYVNIRYNIFLHVYKYLVLIYILYVLKNVQQKNVVTFA